MWIRTLRLGSTSIGAMVLRGGDLDPATVDAVASLAAISLEAGPVIRHRESRPSCPAERRASGERFWMLAHAFKTPLTAIQRRQLRPARNGSSHAG